jgi:hypothetical protein
MFAIMSTALVLAVLGGLAAAIVLGLPVDLSLFDKASAGFRG